MKNIKIQETRTYSKKLLYSLSNFCSKCPLQPKITYIPSIEKIVIETQNNCIDVVIDPTKNKKEVISSIKKQLVRDYPVIYKLEETNLTTEEIDNLIDKGESLDNALLKTKNIKVEFGRLERIHNKFNEFDIYNFEKNTIEKYKGKTPLIFLMDNIQNGEWEVFWKSVYFVNTLGDLS